jgi:hypothetical protein
MPPADSATVVIPSRNIEDDITDTPSALSSRPKAIVFSSGLFRSIEQPRRPAPMLSDYNPIAPRDGSQQP